MHNTKSHAACTVRTRIIHKCLRSYLSLSKFNPLSNEYRQRIESTPSSGPYSLDVQKFRQTVFPREKVQPSVARMFTFG